MKKSILSLALMSVFTVSAQTPRLSLFEEFTGENCPPCAATNPALNALLAQPTNTTKVVAIKWQVPIPSAPTNTWSLYQTNKAEIDWRYKSTAAGGYGYMSQWTSTTAPTSGINAAPTGFIDGKHLWNFGAASDHPANMTSAIISSAQSNTAAFSVTMNRAWDATYSSVNLTVNIVATANFSAVPTPSTNATGTLVFRTVMVEKVINFSTPPGTNGEKDFEDVAIRSFPTLSTGIAMAPTWTVGQSQTFTLNCPVPAYVRDKAEIAFVGFIQDEGTRYVAQAVRAGKAPMNYDAKALSVNIPSLACAAAFIPTVTIGNNGTVAITAMTITPFIDGVAQTNFNWTGNLAGSATTAIALNSYSPATTGGHVFSFSITNVSGGDVNNSNNFNSGAFYLASSYVAGPVVQTFSTTAFPPAGWGMVNLDGGASWSQNATVNGTTSPAGTGAAKYDFYNNDNTGDEDYLIFPPMNLSGSGAPILSFDVAYCQYQTEQDQLDVEVSTDCGATWNNVFSKAGAALSTKAAQTAAFVPTSAQWRKETITLTGYNSPNVLVRFVATSDYGNNMYIDNVNIASCVPPTTSLTASSNSICSGQSATLTASGASSYTWNTGSNNSTVSVNPSATTVYTLTASNQPGCTGTNTIQLVVSACAGILNGLSDQDVSVFPNPASSMVVLSIAKTAVYDLELVNVLGQTVLAQSIQGTAQFDISALKSGVYTLQLKQHNESVYRTQLIRQ